MEQLSTTERYRDLSVHKPTIEFRQRACTLDAAEVKYWVRFLVTLVNLAYAKAVQNPSTDDPDGSPSSPWRYADQQAAKYDERSTESVADMCGPRLLNLSREDVEYWTQREQKDAEQKLQFMAAQRRRRDQDHRQTS